jgi:RNA polymerase sigma factor (sigma-70 family)
MSPSDQAELPPLTTSKWFSEQVHPYEPALRAYLSKRFPSLPDHDDLVQETYSRLLRARETGRLTYARAFLFTAARNAAIDMLRRRRANPHETMTDVAELPVLEEAPGVVDTIERQQRLESLLAAVTSLPERCRQVIMLRYLDGLAYKEIAERLGISPETVKVHMVKGVKDCTAFFQRHGLLETAVNGGAER